MNKAYIRTYWENEPSEKSPINERNLNNIEAGVDEIDNRVITLDTTKATKEEVSPLIKEISFNENNGVFTITRKNGSKFTIDTKLEKIAINFGYDPVTQRISLTLIDGTIQYIDLSALITQYEFMDTDTVSFFIDESGKISAIVKEGSIQEKHLRPNYLAEIKVEAAKAESSASLAEGSATMAESYAHGGTGKREGEDDDNAMEYARQAKESADRASEIAGGEFIPLAEKGVSDGVATLGNNGKVPKEQLNIEPRDIGLGNVPNVSTNDQTPTFTQAATRENIASGNKLSVIFGKIMRWFADLKAVAFSGSYNDLSNKPTALKNPNAVTIKASGTSLGVYDGSVAKEFNITASNTGAVESGGSVSANTVSFTTGDTTDDNANAWTITPQITSESTLAMLFTRVSTMMKNARYLYKLMGTTDISAIGNGTITGAIRELNTGMVMKWKTIFDGIPIKNQEIILDKPLSEYSEVTAIFGYAMSGTIACITDIDTAGLFYIGGISIDANNTYTRCIAIRISEGGQKLTLEIFKQLAHVHLGSHIEAIEGFGVLHLKLYIR